MKLLVKVVEAKFSDSPQIAIVDVNPDFFNTAQKLMSRATVSLRIENGLGEYFFVDRQDLPSLVKAAEGRIADWDKFTHVVLEDEFWSCNWRQIKVHDRCMILDQSGISFKATDAEGFDYLTASLTRSDLASYQPQEKQVFAAATA